MAGMVPDPGEPLDDGGHPRQGPQIGAEAVGACPLAQRSVNLVQLGVGELRLAPGSAGRAQGGEAALSPLPIPATNTLAAHLECASDRGQNLAAAEQLSGLLAPLF